MNIIHRDIKPENILVDGEIVKICDFGGSIRSSSKRQTRFGTAEYFAPELTKNGVSYSSEIDIWCIGVLAYELMAGYPPFTAENFKESAKKIQKTEYKNPSFFSENTKDFLQKTLKSKAEDRLSLLDLEKTNFITKHQKYY